MQIRIAESKSFTLDQAIENLNENKPEFTSLELGSITINPDPVIHDQFGSHSLSHIRDEDLYRLANALKNNTTLESIYINGSDSTRSLEWSEAGAQAIGEALKNHPAIRKIVIELQTFQIGEEQIFGFLHCLTGLATIEILSIEFYRLSNQFINNLGKLLSQKTSLKKFFVNGFSASNLSEEKLSLQDFSIGIGAQENLSSLNISNIQIGNKNMRAIADAMKNIATLTVLKLNRCAIKNDYKPIHDIMMNNTELQELDLSYNPLGEHAIIELTRTLPSLKKLKMVALCDTEFNNASLEYTATLYQEQKLQLPSIDISSNTINDKSIKIIMRLIDGNTSLKDLNLNFCMINDSHINILEPLLSDPTRCQLQKFSFAGEELKSTTYRKLITVLDKNEFISNLTPTRCSSEHRFACDTNVTKSSLREWSTYINTSLCLLVGINIKQTNKLMNPSTGLSSIPSDIVYSILSYLTPLTPHIEKDSATLCFNLLENNIKKRRQLIDEKKYAPEIDLKKSTQEQRKKVISSWWSTSITDSKNNQRVLFIPNHEKTPNTMKLKELLVELTPVLKLANSIQPEDDKGIRINVSKFELKKQLRLKTMLDRFLRMEFGGYAGYYVIPEAELNNNTLVIKGTTLSQLNAVIFRSLEEPVANTNKPCTIM